MQTKHVVVVPYNPKWKMEFEQIKAELVQALGQLAVAVEHVGSTSVEGMSAKPCIDIDVVISDRYVLPQVIARLAAIGYCHEGDLGIAGREAFKYADKPHLQRHHLYVCAQDAAELHCHITFREYLRKHPDAVRQYSQIKEKAAALYPDDMEKYIAYKTPCIEIMYRACGLM